ncbi:MAG TPA: SdrD B-like domain-containing protein, partial [Gemmatales bacterium]|nr:SdrD B-like domain-containing protein [Gemmatales bacterium]
ETSYRLQGLISQTSSAGSYQLIVFANGITTPGGTAGIGSYEVDWTNNQTTPSPASQLRFQPDAGLSAVDGLTNLRQGILSGVLPGLVHRVTLFDLTNQRELGQFTPTESTFAWPIDLASPGNHRVRVRVSDQTGNFSDAELVIVVDETVPTLVQITGAQSGSDPVDELFLQFSESMDPATVGLEDFALSRNDGSDLLGSATGLGLQWLDSRTVKLTGTGSLTSQPGVYQFHVKPGSMADEAGNTLGSSTDSVFAITPPPVPDTTTPTSVVNALPTQSDPAFMVSWTGSDDTGIASYDVLVSTNGGSFEMWLPNTTLTSSLFVGQPGNRYAFQVIARDEAGNTEALSSLPESETLIKTTFMQGRLFNDANANGRQDVGEKNIAGARVNVTWLGFDGQVGGGDDLQFQTTSDSQGFWSLQKLYPGNQLVVVDQLPAGARTPTFDPDSSVTHPDGQALIKLNSAENRNNVIF